eukprot:TRINITY_DN7998_c1_g2_i2.p1 TRINITY_DN7998_c1_g2~~TRINITY_DN7998_c1_g2_i2.p1  ORF type:complete len:452 (-),score=42.17 TRINITY_DN7998_c1_g2_i2:22-1377(-)
MQQSDEKLKEQLQCWMEEIKIPPQTLLDNFQVLRFPKKVIHQRIEDLKELGFKDVLKILASRPTIINHNKKDIQKKIDLLCKQLGIDKQQVIDLFDQFSGGILAGQTNTIKMVSELENLGFDKKEIFQMQNKYSSLFRIQTHRLNSMHRYFKQIGINTKNVLSQKPGILRTSLNRLQRMVDHLKQKGIQNETIEQIMIYRPIIMTWEPKTIDDKYDAFLTLEITDEQVSNILNKKYELLSVSGDKIHGHFQNLRIIGFDNQDIFNFVFRFDDMFRYPVQNVRKNFQFFQEQGFDKEGIKTIIQKVPRLSNLSIDKLNSNWGILRQLNKFENSKQMVDLITEFPFLLTQNLSNEEFQQKIRFIVEKVGVSFQEVLQKDTQFLKYSLLDRIGPRILFVKDNGSCGFGFIEMDKYLSLSDEEFSQLAGMQMDSLLQYKQQVEDWLNSLQDDKES